MIRDKIVLGIRELLKVRDLNLTKCVDACRAVENANLHVVDWSEQLLQDSSLNS